VNCHQQFKFCCSFYDDDDDDDLRYVCEYRCKSECMYVCMCVCVDENAKEMLVKMKKHFAFFLLLLLFNRCRQTSEIKVSIGRRRRKKKE
jgi:hypothetical protein